MKITKHKSQELYTCTVNGKSYTSPSYDNVTSWRDDQTEDHEYNRELRELNNIATTHYYNKGWSLD